MSAATREALDCVRFLLDGDDAARDAAVERLVALDALADSVVLDALRDPNVEASVLLGLRAVLRHTASERHTEPLVAILLDAKYDRPSVHFSARVVAARSLGFVGGRRACEALLRVLTRFVETRERELWSVAWRAIQSLGQCAYAPAAPVLVEALAHPDFEINGDACCALIEIGAPAVPAVLSFHRYGPDDERHVALWILARIGDPRVASVALRAVADRSNPVAIRAYGALAVGSSKADGAFELLTSILDDATEETWVRQLAAHGLGRLGDRRAFTKLLALMRGDRGHESVAAIDALGLLGDFRATACLIGLLGSDDVQIVRQAVRALGALGDASALPSLRALLTYDRSGSVAFYAARAVAELEALEPSPEARTHA